MSRPPVPINAGDWHGHWLVLKQAGKRKHADQRRGTRQRETYLVKAKCCDFTKVMGRGDLLYSAKLPDTCVKCAPRVKKAKTKAVKARAQRKPVRQEMRRCLVVTRDHVCGSLVYTEDLVEHLRERHGLGPMSTAYGPVLRLDDPTPGRDDEEPDEGYITGVAR